MALPTSGTISIGSLRNFFGDTGSSSLSEFYRGSALVPSTESVAVSVPYTYYTYTTENQTTYQTQYTTQTESDYNTSTGYFHRITTGSSPNSYLLWAGAQKFYYPYAGVYSISHSDGWTYGANGTQYSVGVAGGTATISGVYRTRLVATQVAVTTPVQVTNGPYTGYTTEYQNQNQNTSVATSGSISLSQFYGASN